MVVLLQAPGLVGRIHLQPKQGEASMLILETIAVYVILAGAASAFVQAVK